MEEHPHFALRPGEIGGELGNRPLVALDLPLPPLRLGRELVVAAVRWGSRKALAYETDPLLAVETPNLSSDTSERIYSPEETRKLSAPPTKTGG